MIWIYREGTFANSDILWSKSSFFCFIGAQYKSNIDIPSNSINAIQGYN